MGEGDLIVDNRGEEEAGEEEGDEIDFKKIGKTVSLCLSARTALFLPYKVCCVIVFFVDGSILVCSPCYWLILFSSRSGHHRLLPTVTTILTSV
jgi:hypothetical protein